MEKRAKNRIVIFDGICNLCNDSVMLIIKNDKKGVFSFSPIQSAFSIDILKSGNSYVHIPDSLILIENNRPYFKSTAALKIARKMDKLWPLFYVFIILPESFRDLFYDFLAKNRYRWFGKKDSCMMPSKEIESRFISSPNR